nr:BOS complex subunit NOMO1 [Pongo abelii]
MAEYQGMLDSFSLYLARAHRCLLETRVLRKENSPCVLCRKVPVWAQGGGPGILLWQVQCGILTAFAISQDFTLALLMPHPVWDCVSVSKHVWLCFSLQVKLYKSENLDNPIQTVSLGQSLFFHFPPLLRDGENYVVLLDSTLPRSQYDYILPQVSFTAVGYHKHITLIFNPTRKLPEQDIAQGSYIALPLTLLVLLAGYNHDKLIPLLLQLTSRLQGVRALGQAASDNSGLEDAKRQAKKQKTRRT